MTAKLSLRRTVLPVFCLVLGAGGAAFGQQDSAGAGVSVLRGTPPPAQQHPVQQTIIVAPQPPSCPNGYVYSPMAGYCYQPRDPTAAIR